MFFNAWLSHQSAFSLEWSAAFKSLSDIRRIFTILPPAESKHLVIINIGNLAKPGLYVTIRI